MHLCPHFFEPTPHLISILAIFLSKCGNITTSSINEVEKTPMTSHAFFDNKSGTAKYDADSVVIDAEIENIRREMGYRTPYTEAAREFARRYSAFTPDSSDYEELAKKQHQVG